MGKAFLVLFAIMFLGTGCSVLWGVNTYNGLVEADESVSESWSQVENVYQRRLDLVPNLVATVRGYAEHEQETFTAVTQARASVGQANVQIGEGGLTAENLAAFQAAQGELTNALSRLMVVQEAYPELKANDLFVNLMDELSGTENRISIERRRYNEAAREFNSDVRKFPRNLVAGFGGFEQKPYFEAQEGADVAPTVDFSR